MIAVQLMGGLGNQMFQYSAGLNLAVRHGTGLVLDLSWFEGQDKRRYALGAYRISGRMATAPEVAALRRARGGILAGLRRLVRGEGGGSRRIRERGYAFDPKITTLPDNVFLEGYWQDERYFRDIRDIIKGEFTLADPPRGDNLEMARQITSSASVSLHVRRGDYASDARTLSFHGQCGPDYYLRAAEEMGRRVSDLRYFVFSDEPSWLSGNVDLPGPCTVVDINGPDQPHLDLWLLSQCRHHIIANSSFSWWGAWLCENASKQVIAPRQWFREPGWEGLSPVPPGWRVL